MEAPGKHELLGQKNSATQVPDKHASLEGFDKGRRQGCDALSLGTHHRGATSWRMSEQCIHVQRTGTARAVSSGGVPPQTQPRVAQILKSTDLKNNKK